jgi:hypothetical protein
MADLTTTLLQVQPGDLIKLRNLLLVSVTIPLILFLIRRWYADHMQRKDRRRQMYAEAFAVCMEYKEFPYVIYRRGKKDPEAERVRISEAIRDVQKRLAYHQVWLRTESGYVSAAYEKLVAQLRELPGKEMKKAWRTRPITRDDQMIIANPIDWKKLDEAADDYIKAVTRKLAPWWNLKEKLGK